MIFVLYGALGTLGVLALVGLGFLAGWKARGEWVKHTRKALAEELTEEERMDVLAQQKAFEGMLNYNMDTAYGMHVSLEELAGGDV